ncbi:MAG TPA: sensor domain-containing phosphodiesterase [Candidatus Saccharimonadia bacterium]|nr:sensor domain-containing phosphodiesterase [Candidatus Saccharimonadia bacterium]
MATPRGAVLVVVMGRDDRRVLFEAFDAAEFEAVYTAKDFAQAQAFLRQDARLDAVLLEFAGEATEAVAFCSAMAASARFAKVPVLGIATLADLAARWGWERSPPGVVDWLRSPVLAAEALHRIDRAAHRPVASSAPGRPAAPAPAAETNADDYRFAFDASFDELVLSDLRTGLILDINPRFEESIGVLRAQLIGTAFDALNLGLSETDRKQVRALLQRDGQVRFRCMRVRPDGTRYPADAVMKLVARGLDTACLSSFRPAQDRADARASAAALGLPLEVMRIHGGNVIEEVAQFVERTMPNSFVTVVVSRSEQGEAPVTIYERTPEPGKKLELGWEALLQRIGTEGTIIVPHGAAMSLADEAGLAALKIEALVVLPMSDERGALHGMLVVASAGTIENDAPTRALLETSAARIALFLELERAREQGRAKGLQDSLTGLPNRLLFNDRLDTTIKEAHRTGETFAVLFVDLDRFKNINDSLGHAVGDEVLVTTGKRLRACVRGSDTVARYAGDEFTLILRHIVQRDDVLRVAEKICRVLESSLVLSDERELHITSSIGVSFYPDDATTAEKLLQHADVAMYSAKGLGRNTYQTYVAVPEESHQQRLALEAKLRQAEKNGELRVFYQPQVAAESEDIVGMEALIRWEHPELGMISPGFFIPLAEETGLIVSIGEWVLRQACSDAKRWQQRFGLDLRIGVNLSALQLRQPNLVEVVERALGDTELNPDHLELEVTESLNVKSIPNLLETLQALRELGCKIAIDDFGTGQSSLDYIRRFPADRIKIDQVFVRNIGVDPDDEAIVRATINMAHNLNRAVVAEGVEFEEHLVFLRDHGCEELQGYLFSRPLPAATFENLLAERERLMGAVESA